MSVATAARRSQQVRSEAAREVARPTSPPVRASLGALTGLRFFAAFGVVLYHFDRTPLTAWQPLRNIVAGGFTAVSLFFLLSGFILAYTYLTPEGALVGTRRNFWVSRFARVYPAYLLALVLALPTDILTSLRVNTARVAILKLVTGAVAVLSLQQAWTPFTAWALNFPAWSVSVEAFFYLLFPLIGPRLARLRGRAAWHCALWLWGALLVPPLALLVTKGFTGAPGAGDHLEMAVEFTPLFRLPEFALGILLGRAFTAGELHRLRGRNVAPLAVLAVLALLACTPLLPHPLMAAGLMTPLFALLLAALAQDQGWLGYGLSRPLPVLLGEASYGIYILQVPVAFVIGLAPPLYEPKILGVYCVALLVAALLSFRLVESPLRLRLKRWLGEPQEVERRRLSPAGRHARMREALGAPDGTRRAVLVGLGAAAATGFADTLAQRRHFRATVPASPAEVDWVTTTQGHPFVPQGLRSAGERWAALQIEVDTAQPLQTIEGFGGCFHEMGWSTLSALRPGDREAVLRELYAPGVGANLTLGRMPMGANDFAHSWYSLDEVPGDLALRHFSIDRDREALIPFLRAAQAFQPGLRLWACPWSPPSWMKRNDFYAEAEPGSGEFQTGIRKDQVARDGAEMFILEEPYLQSYANYFGRFVDAYRAEGIPISIVMPQNEWNSAHPFPSCTWTPEGLAQFLRFLGPVMSARGVEIYLGTVESADPGLVRRVLQEPEVRSQLRGVGVQWAARTATRSIHESFPEMKLLQSEQECGDSHNSWRYCVYCWDQMRDYFEGGANAYMYWNLALPEGGASHWGWRQNSLLTVDPQARNYRFNPEYWLLKHVSHYVRPGARRLRTWGFAAEALAFRNPDGSVAVTLRNGLPVRRPVDVLIGGRRVEGSLPPDSFSTVLLRA